MTACTGSSCDMCDPAVGAVDKEAASKGAEHRRMTEKFDITGEFMGQDRVLRLLGLARKARKVVSGEFAVEKAVQSKKACVVFVAEDASENTKKLFSDKCSYYGIPCITYGTKESLGNAIGSGARASVAVMDPGLSDALRKAIGL